MKVKRLQNLLTMLTIFLASSTSFAQGVTGTDLLNLLVENEVVSKEKAKTMVDTLQRQAPSSAGESKPGPDNNAVLQLLVEEGIVSEDQAGDLLERVERRADAADVAEQTNNANASNDEVRIPYIPDYLQKDMEERLKFAVKSDIVEAVHEDVVRTARVQGWGIKEAPSWVHKVKISGDGRVRYQGDFYPEDNARYAGTDVSAVNNNGTSDFRSIYDNVNDNRNRLRSRFRLNVKAKPFETVSLGMRLTTGNQGNPVSSNQTLGNYGEKWETSMDLGYIHYKAMEKDIEIWGGRFKSPMLKTDLIFDNDMTFEGLASSYFFLRNDSMYENDSQWDPYVTVGLYPIQEIHQFVIETTPTGAAGVDANLDFDNDHDKMLYALQFGTSYDFYSTNQLKFALSLYHYDNITGRKNQRQNNSLQNVTSGEFYQAGNAIFNIANDPSGNDIRYALASEYSLVNTTVTYRVANFYPVYVDLHADYVKNVAFDKEKIDARIGGGADIPERDTGYQLGFSLGTFDVKHRYDWRVGFTYRHLEGDAALDAFADSDFLLGGTDAEGYMVYGQYGLLDNVIGALKLITADSIDIDPADGFFNISTDTVFLDVTARF